MPRVQPSGWGWGGAADSLVCLGGHQPVVEAEVGGPFRSELRKGVRSSSHYPRDQVAVRCGTR